MDYNLKYKYHKDGNEHYKKGEYEKAIECYNKAIECDPKLLETYFNRALAYIRLKKYDPALKDLEKCSEINPKLGEVYYTMGLAYEYKKCYDEAIGCYNKSLEIEPDYEKAGIQKIATFVNGIRAFIGKQEKFLKWIEKNEAGIDDKKKLELIGKVKKELQNEIGDYERPSCDINCGSVCCHFEKEPWNYSVLIESRKLEAVRDFLKVTGENSEDYIGSVEWDSLSKEDKERGMDMKKYFVEGDGRKYIYFPKTDGLRLLPKEFAANVPKSMSNEDVEWANEKSHPCKFLDENGCRLHNLGSGKGRGLDVCREWICLTGFMIDRLRRLRIMDVPDSKVDMGLLNRLTHDNAEYLYRNLYGCREFTELSDRREKLVKRIVESQNSPGEIYTDFESAEMEYGNFIGNFSVQMRKHLEDYLSASEK